MNLRRCIRNLSGLKSFVLGALASFMLLLLLHQNNRNSGNTLVSYYHEHQLIWIGGIPRSGATLFRVMLDSHPSIRCGEETPLIPIMLNIHSKILHSERDINLLREARISEDTINQALGSYILSIIGGNGRIAERYCNKDPFSLRHMLRILKIFPNSKFLLVIRDPRATVHSLMSNKVKIKNFNTNTHREAFREWNRAMAQMYHQCMEAGPDRCLKVFYEQLVLHPMTEMKKILSYLGVDWHEGVVNHHLTAGKPNGAALSKSEADSPLAQPVNLDGLTKWVGQIPTDILYEIDKLAPMLKLLGYKSRIPMRGKEIYYYGIPDDEILDRHNGVSNDNS